LENSLFEFWSIGIEHKPFRWFGTGDNMKQKKLFSLDDESIEQLDVLSKHYDMNKSETVRRLIAQVYQRECEETVELHFNLPVITGESIVRRALELGKTQARYISDLVSADLAHEDANVRALAQMGITGRTCGVVE
jgi:predicted DNA-binding protein